MSLRRFYLPVELDANIEVALTPDVYHHAIHVLRLEQGESLVVFNGKGGEYPATIESVSKKQCLIKTDVRNTRNNESPLHSHLAIALSKGDRFDFVLQKATELGVSEITPLQTDRTEVRLSEERMEKKLKSWKKIIINACEQCHRNILPVLNNPICIDEFLQQKQEGTKILLHTAANEKAADIAKIPNPKMLFIMAGPEGGFTDREVTEAKDRDYQFVLLGSRILRTETAPLSILSIAQYLWGDMNSA